MHCNHDSPHSNACARISQTRTTHKCLYSFNKSSLFHVMPPDLLADFGIEPNTFMNDIYFTHCTQAGHTDDVIQSYFKCGGVCMGGCVLKHGGRFAITA